MFFSSDGCACQPLNPKLEPSETFKQTVSSPKSHSSEIPKQKPQIKAREALKPNTSAYPRIL